MADLEQVSLTVEESGLPKAMDAWFSALSGLVGINGTQKLALLSSIATYEIDPDAPMFNQFIFRSWVDRSIVSSPSDPGSPSFLARYSNVFVELMTRSTAKIEAEVPAPEQARIDTLLEEITAIQTKIEAEDKRVGDAWATEAKRRGLDKPDSPEYIIARIGFNGGELEYTKLKQLSALIARKNTKITQIRDAALSLEDRTLLQLYEFETLQEYQVKRPKISSVEKTYKLDPVTLADFRKYNIPGVFEDGQDILPSVKLEQILKRQGARTIELEKSSSVTVTHESQWNVAGGGIGLVSWSVHAGGKSKFTETIKRLGKLSISFENIEEVFAIRGPWFAMSGFSHPSSQEQLKKDQKGLAAPLANLIHSVIIVRGTKLTLHFDNSDDWDKFTETTAGGGGSFFGIPIGPSTGGGGSMTENARDRVQSTITFADASDVCRVVGFRIQPVLAGVTPREIFEPWESKETADFVTMLRNDPGKFLEAP